MSDLENIKYILSENDLIKADRKELHKLLPQTAENDAKEIIGEEIFSFNNSSSEADFITKFQEETSEAETERIELAFNDTLTSRNLKEFFSDESKEYGKKMGEMISFYNEKNGNVEYKTITFLNYPEYYTKISSHMRKKREKDTGITEEVMFENLVTDTTKISLSEQIAKTRAYTSKTDNDNNSGHHLNEIFTNEYSKKTNIVKGYARIYDNEFCTDTFRGAHSSEKTIGEFLNQEENPTENDFQFGKMFYPGSLFMPYWKCSPVFRVVTTKQKNISASILMNGALIPMRVTRTSKYFDGENYLYSYLVAYPEYAVGNKSNKMVTNLCCDGILIFPEETDGARDDIWGTDCKTVARDLDENQIKEENTELDNGKKYLETINDSFESSGLSKGLVFGKLYSSNVIFNTKASYKTDSAIETN